ncbi:MAG: sulfotransferase, partial [Solirubrobacteraceae bacterium]
MTGSVEASVPSAGEGAPAAVGARAGAGPRGRVPDFFIVGHPKCGTTALYEMLRRHPQIFMPELKEPRFFDEDLRARFLPGAPDRGAPPTIPGTLEQYLSLFERATPEQRAGEASPSYLMSSVAARAIARAQPAARIIAILREPVSFLRSLQLELVQNHIERERDFRTAISNERLGPLRRGGETISPPVCR